MNHNFIRVTYLLTMEQLQYPIFEALASYLSNRDLNAFLRTNTDKYSNATTTLKSTLRESNLIEFSEKSAPLRYKSSKVGLFCNKHNLHIREIADKLDLLKSIKIEDHGVTVHIIDSHHPLADLNVNIETVNTASLELIPNTKDAMITLSTTPKFSFEMSVDSGTLCKITPKSTYYVTYAADYNGDIKVSLYGQMSMSEFANVFFSHRAPECQVIDCINLSRLNYYTCQEHIHLAKTDNRGLDCVFCLYEKHTGQKVPANHT